MRLDDHFRVASITKTFVATVVLQLVAEGVLSLDDRLEPFITGIPNGDEITLRQLLNMTAGIYNYIYDPVIAVDYDRDPLLPFTPEQAVEIVRAHGEADFPPGSRRCTPTPTTSCSVSLSNRSRAARSLRRSRSGSSSRSV